MIRSLRPHPHFVLLGVAAWILAAPAFAAGGPGPARLVADFAPGSLEGSQNISGFARVGSRSVFLRDDNDHVPALWITDGTAQGTTLLAVLCPPCGRGELLGSTGSVAFYRVSGFYPDFETRIWRTDGTPAGTFPVTGTFKLPLLPGVPGVVELPVLSSLAGGRLFFVVCPTGSACEAWSSDGSPAGTARLGEIDCGEELYNICELVAVGDQAFLIADGPGGVLSLWLADGPAHSLVLLKETPLAHFLSPGAGRVFFVAEDDGLEIWTSDGTAAGTRSITSLGPPDAIESIFKSIDGRLYFVAKEQGLGHELWSIGAAAESLRRLTNFSDPDAGVFSVEKAGDRIVFVARQGQTGFKLWSSRGDLQTTAPLAGCPGGCPFVASELAPLGNGRLVLYGNGGKGGFWVTDGSGAGTRLLAQGRQRRNFAQFATAAGRALFVITNELADPELWLTDGSKAGTFFVTHGGPGWSHYIGWSSPLFIGATNSRLLFPAGILQPALWISDGTPAGSRPLIDSLWPNSSQPQHLASFRGGLLVEDRANGGCELRRVSGAETTRLPVSPCFSLSSAPVELEKAALFLLSQNEGVSLWRTDGTAGGTTALVPAAGSGQPAEVTRFGGQAAFWQASPGPDNGLASQLWLTDGTPAGTRKLLDLPANVEMYNLTGIGGKLYFFDQERQGEASAWRPWVSDGTSAGTYPLTGAIAPHAPSVPLGRLSFVALGGRVFFPFEDGDGSVEIGSSDGTPAGTSRAVTAASGMLESQALTIAGGRLYFAARRSSDPGGPLLPWVSDGTDAGTALLADAALSEEASAPLGRTPFTELSGRVFFAAADAARGDELWSTDGTPQGTKLVRDIAAGLLGSYPRGMVVWRGKLYFRARDRLHGMELWVSDGSREGTRLVQDIAAETSWSAPQELTVTGQGLYFSANDGAHGRELWVLPATDALEGDP